MESKALREANREADKWRATLQQDYINLRKYRLKMKKTLATLDLIKDDLVSIIDRHETRAGASFSQCYLLNSIASTGKLIQNLEKLIENIEGEQEKWRTRNLYLAIDPKKKNM